MTGVGEVEGKHGGISDSHGSRGDDDDGHSHSRYPSTAKMWSPSTMTVMGSVKVIVTAAQ